MLTMNMGNRRSRTAKETSHRRSYGIFLSHSNNDEWLAGVIAEKIEAAGIKVWLDEMSLAGGESVTNAVIRGIRNSDEAVVLVSNQSLRSQWVAAEIGMAMAVKKRITPLLNNVDEDAMAPLKGVKSYELNRFDKFFGELKQRAVKR